MTTKTRQGAPGRAGLADRKPPGIACYCSGTSILTARGESPVETLAVGDGLVTASGRVKPLRWIGRRSFAGRFMQRNRALLPIGFAAGSLGNGLPRRDLFVSPSHAMFLDGVLIPAVHLVNGSTVVVMDDMDAVNYVHLELADHDVILAEGAPSETFLDTGCRGMFQNAAEYARLYPDAEPVTGPCAPRVTEGPAVEAVRRRLAQHAATWMSAEPRRRTRVRKGVPPG